ncbi:MAG: cell envelope integrity protein TolA [Clostridiales bacterium]|nr:cell envelope integrity protein TolA [Clostridiales bacterium]
MTFKLKKTELIKALITVLCSLAVAFAVVLLLPRGVASADETDTEEATCTVTWKYQVSNGEWHSFVNGTTLYTYDDGVDYIDRIRAEVKDGDDVTEVYYDSQDMHLSFAVGEESATAVANAANYTAIIDGASADIADADKKITFTIAPDVLDLHDSDFADYHGDGEPNRLWVLTDGENATALGDCMTHFNPDAEYNSEYGASVTIGMLYNSYVRYTGDEYTVELNKNYQINDNKTLNDYMSAVSVSYEAQTAAGEANKVNKITTTATITLADNWVLDNGEKTITLTKDWYIVTLHNALRTLEGDKDTTVEGWALGSEVSALDIRPEHGDYAVFTLASGDTVLSRFAVQYSGTGSSTVIKYYDVQMGQGEYVIDTTKQLDDDYYTAQLDLLEVGNYTLNVYVPAYTSTDDHEHWWWDNNDHEAAGVVFCSLSRTYGFGVACYEVNAENVSLDEADNKDITIKLLTDKVEYNAKNNNVPQAVVTFRGVELVPLDDYELTSESVKVGKASFMFVGKGNFIGSVPFDEVYEITPAVNSWQDVPSIMYWTYGNYDKQMNLITARPTYLDNNADLSFKITTDQAGETPAADVLASFTLTDGLVSDDVAESLTALPAGTYYLIAAVKGSTNYKALMHRGVPFKVFRASNRWDVTPAVVVWTEGQFKSTNLPVAKPLYGDVNIVIKDGDGKDIYNNVTGVNKLSSAKAGMYTLTAIVIGSGDYDGLEYSTVFAIHEKAGIPVWATVLIVIGALLIVALIVLVLIKKGVLRILTDKLMIDIRTQAAVDATVAAIRASKKNYEYKQQMDEVNQQREAEAKREEQKEARKARAAEQKALPVDLKIAALEEKARKAEARAEKMRERAEAIQQLANRMRETANPEQAPAPNGTEELKPEPTPAPVQEPTAAPVETPTEQAPAAPTVEGTAEEPKAETAATKKKPSTAKKPAQSKTSTAKKPSQNKK